MKNSEASQRGRLFLFCFAILIALALWIFGVNGLGPIDDHHFISTIFQGKEMGFYVIPELARFVPLTAQDYVLAAKIWEPSPQFFFAIGAIKTLICGVLLLNCLALTGAANWAVATLWCVAILSIGFANAAFRLQVGELNALLLTLIFVWTTMSAEKAAAPLSARTRALVAGGVVAFAVAQFYKELIFVFALAFGVAEILRHYRKAQARIPYRVFAILATGAAYIAFYGFWRVTYATGSYAGFHSIATWQIVNRYAINDPFIIFIVLPLTAVRVVLCIRDAKQHTLYDSFLVAASAYAAAFIALGMFNTYYLLPSYGFAVCGVAGVLARKAAFGLTTAVIAIAGVLAANNMPVAVSDMQTLRSISINHYQFVRFLSEWLWANPLPNSERRNLVFVGVTPGNGVEVLLSLKQYLAAQGTSEAAYDIRATEPTDNPAITSFYREREQSLSVFNDGAGYSAKTGDLLIFNPYQAVVLPPPLLAPSYREIFRSGSEWALPRWPGWNWINICVLRPRDCVASVSERMRYAGYAAMLVSRQAAPVQLVPLKSPSYRIGPMLLPTRMRRGAVQQIDVLIENAGEESWPANGTFAPGSFVNLAYVWTNADGQVVLEGDRSPFPETIRPRDRTKVSVLLKTPAAAGRYKLMISPVQEGVRWFYKDNPIDVTRDIEVF